MSLSGPALTEETQIKRQRAEDEWMILERPLKINALITIWAVARRGLEIGMSCTGWEEGGGSRFYF